MSRVLHFLAAGGPRPILHQRTRLAVEIGRRQHIARRPRAHAFRARWYGFGDINTPRYSDFNGQVSMTVRAPASTYVKWRVIRRGYQRELSHDDVDRAASAHRYDRRGHYFCGAIFVRAYT